MAGGVRIRIGLARAAHTLQALPSPRLDAEVLCAYVLHTSREFLFTHPEQLLTAGQHKRYAKLIQRRKNWEPVAYITGTKEFFGLPFRVNRHVLLPHPETELLVEQTLTILRSQYATQHPWVMDVGTGSGAIAISIKKYAAHARVTAIDKSILAIRTAQKNAATHHVNIRWKQTDILKHIPAHSVDVIVANLPYLDEHDMRDPSIQFEPRQALWGGKTGLQYNQQLLAQAAQVLRPQGHLLFEIGKKQATALIARAQQLFPLAQISLLQDLAGLDRVIHIDLRTAQK